MLMPCTQPPPRTLYLAANEHKRVSNTDAALVVQTACGQTLRYPTARILRIVSATCVDWTGSALMLCQRKSIPITWLDNRGNTLGTLFPASALDRPLHQILEIVFESETGMRAFHNWLQHRRMCVLQAWAHASKPLLPGQWEEKRRQWVYRQQIEEHLPKGMYDLCHAYAAACFAHAGLRPDYLDHQAHNIPLLQILLHLLWAQINFCTGAIGEKADDFATQVQLMDRWQTRNAHVLPEHLYSLHRWAIAQARHP